MTDENLPLWTHDRIEEARKERGTKGQADVFYFTALYKAMCDAYDKGYEVGKLAGFKVGMELATGTTVDRLIEKDA